MSIYFLLFSLSLTCLYAQTPVHGTSSSPTTRATISPEDLLKQKEHEYRRQAEELKIKQDALDNWEKELNEAKKSRNTAALTGTASFVIIPATYFLGGKILKKIAPKGPVKKFFSVAKAKQFLAAHPKFFGSIVIAAAGGATYESYNWWALSAEEVEELSQKVALAKKEADEAQAKLDRALAQLEGRKPSTIPPPQGDTPDTLDGNE